MQKYHGLGETGKKAIEEKMKDLLEVCQIYKAPMFAAAAVADDGKTTEYNNITYGGASHNIALSDDQIRKHILIAGGFDAVPSRDVMDINGLMAKDEHHRKEGQ